MIIWSGNIDIGSKTTELNIYHVTSVANNVANPLIFLYVIVVLYVIMILTLTFERKDTAFTLKKF